MVKALIKLIEFYEKFFAKILASGMLGGVVTQCRFQPTCANYAKAALNQFGFWRGSKLALHRLLLCNPFTNIKYHPHHL